MSEGFADSDLAGITGRFRDLSITVRGPASQTSELVGALARQHSAAVRSVSPTRSESHYSLVGETTPAPRRESREEIERSFSPCPSEYLSGARRLSGSVF